MPSLTIYNNEEQQNFYEQDNKDPKKSLHMLNLQW